MSRGQGELFHNTRLCMLGTIHFILNVYTILVQKYRLQCVGSWMEKLITILPTIHWLWHWNCPLCLCASVPMNWSLSQSTSYHSEEGAQVLISYWSGFNPGFPSQRDVWWFGSHSAHLCSVPDVSSQCAVTLNRCLLLKFGAWLCQMCLYEPAFWAQIIGNTDRQVVPGTQNIACFWWYIFDCCASEIACFM